MIRFKQYLSEARLAPLYHGTSESNAQQILRDNRIEGSYDDKFDNVGVSLSRNVGTAGWFATKDRKKWISNLGSHGVVFELDQQKLAQRYKITPVNYWSSMGRIKDNAIGARSEFEERVIGSINDLDKYIIKVITTAKPGRAIPGNMVLSHPKLYYNGKFINK